MATVAVPERVYPDQAVVKANGSLEKGHARFRRLPSRYIATQLSDLLYDLSGRNTDAGLASAIPSRPIPYALEHLSVNVTDQRLVEPKAPLPQIPSRCSKWSCPGFNDGHRLVIQAADRCLLS